MNESSLKLDMVLARAGEIEWSPPASIKKAEPQKPIELDLNTIEKMVGFTHILFSNSNYKIIKSAWVDKFTTYYGEFSEGISIKYQIFDKKDKFFIVEQHKIIRSDSPEMFIYPSTVTAYQKKINGGLATIVLPPVELSISFAELVIENMLLKVLFSWPIDKITVEEIINSLV